jgi:hypothetical protein
MKKLKLKSFAMKQLITCTLFLLSSVICFSQTTPQQTSQFDINKLEFGGNLGFSFGNNYSSVIISPQVGYALDPHFSAGLGVNYSYYRYSYDSYNKSSLNYMGFNLYGRVKPANNIVLQMQPEIFRVWGSSYDSSVSELVTTLLIGGGVIIPMGNRRGISMMLYYDLVQNKYSPYRNGIFYSVGYTISL